MLLRASSQQDGLDCNLNSVTQAEVASGVPHGEWLRKLTDATIRNDWLTLAALRTPAEANIGEQAVVDALTVAAAFNGITRVADATGIPLDAHTAQTTTQLRAATGIEQFDYTQKSQRYG